MPIKVGAEVDIFLWDVLKRRFIPACKLDTTPDRGSSVVYLTDFPLSLSETTADFSGAPVVLKISPVMSSFTFTSSCIAAVKNLRRLVDKRYLFVFAPLVKFRREIYSALPDHVRASKADEGLFEAYSSGCSSIYGQPHFFSYPNDPVFIGRGRLNIYWGLDGMNQTSQEVLEDSNTLANDIAIAILSMNPEIVASVPFCTRSTLDPYMHPEQRNCSLFKPLEGGGVQLVSPYNSWCSSSKRIEAVASFVFNAVGELHERGEVQSRYVRPARAEDICDLAQEKPLPNSERKGVF